ncbi:MAG: HEAT repeat domain-containing protein, partial [bacterium]
AIPVLIDRLSDPDPVVRLASHEALKRRTGQNFGYQPYIEGDELAAAVGRWKQWWAGTTNGRMVAGRPSPSPQATPQVRQSNMGPKALSEARYQKKRGPLQRLFGRDN